MIKMEINRQCPFCGESMSVVLFGETRCQILCCGCGVAGPEGDSYGEVIEQWEAFLCGAWASYEVRKMSTVERRGINEESTDT